MKIGLVQYDPKWEDKTENKLKLNSLLKENIGDIDLLIFPEMTLTGFTMRSEVYSENMESESFKYFVGVAKEYECDIVAGIIEKNSGSHFNTLLHISREGILENSYRKIHPFSYSNEDKHFTPGLEPVVTDINGWKAGLSICYDLRFPELYRFYGKEKTELIIVIANWPDTRIEHWRTLLKARAIENQCYVAGVNRVGDDPKLHYTGCSSVFDPMGKELVSIENKEKLITVKIDKNYVKEVRNKFPFLEDIKLV
ncbi:MAG: carbon-nitrogen family hydrolase [Ignavibacteriaceae bacterium]